MNQGQYKDRQNVVDEIKKKLLSHGIRMSVWGCGCCNSPEVQFEYQGEMMLPEEAGENVVFDMFKRDE